MTNYQQQLLTEIFLRESKERVCEATHLHLLCIFLQDKAFITHADRPNPYVNKDRVVLQSIQWNLQVIRLDKVPYVFHISTHSDQDVKFWTKNGT